MKESVDRIRSQRSLVFGHISNGLLTEGRENVLEGYYRAQLRIARGKTTKAHNILRSLDKNVIYQRLEEEHGDLLAAIDIAVRGKSNRRNFKGDPIEPLFRLNHS